MSDQVLRKSQNLWQWLTHQPGDIVFPPAPYVAPPPPTALQVINEELLRIHAQIENMQCDNDYSERDDLILALTTRLDKLHDELARRSKDETLPAR